MASRVRADDRLIALGLATSRAEAARLFLAGLVYDGTQRIDKASEKIGADAALAVRERPRFVSRGGTKLDAALERFGIDVAGAVCLDAGCSTGGFTHCLLTRGAARVYAVDVGYGQFAWQLRNDPRVVLMERTNIRAVDASKLDPLPSIVVADLSFVSLTSVLPRMAALAALDAVLVLLIKPQFEVGPDHLEDGIVTDEQVRRLAVTAVHDRACECGLVTRGIMESPIQGTEGNVEYLMVADKISRADRRGTRFDRGQR
ncbi:MAG TPA: TlyA family RNA methyltransferase [Candidatus Binatia bacterium]|nr:TlyA family RNA methyltransferase [Candidatus Binatia bacterium]